MKNMRKSRFFQSDAYISVDFLKKTAEILRMKNITDEQDIDPMAMVIDLGPNKGKKQMGLNILIQGSLSSCIGL